MTKRKSKTWLGLVGIMSSVLLPQAAGAQVSVAPELQRKIATYPHTRQLTDWGSRPDWSANSKHLIFLNKEFGDVYELDVTTGRTLPLTYGYPHEGVLRAYYLKDGNFLLTAARDHIAGLEPYTRILESELWLLDKNLTSPPPRSAQRQEYRRRRGRARQLEDRLDGERQESAAQAATEISRRPADHHP